MTASLTDTRSAELYRRALEVMPGGVNSPVRAMRAIGRDPLFIERGEGAELIDVDGNRYVDYVCSWGPLIHGHAHPRRARRGRARRRRAARASARPPPGEVELAVEVGAADGGRGDAAHDLLRDRGHDDRHPPRARRHRPRAGPQVRGRLPRPRRRPARPGRLGPGHAGAARQPRRARRARPPARWWCRGTTPTRCARPPSATSSRRSSPSRCPRTWASSRRSAGFLELLRERADANGALLVLDEVISGFRVARGGAQELMGVSGDLTIMGKVIGGGLPAAAVGGRGRADADARARRRGLPGGHAVGQPARGRRRAGDARAARRARLPALWPRSPSGSPTACARRRPAAAARCRSRASRAC